MSISNKISIKDVDLKDKRVLLRADFNVPMKSGRIINSIRIDSTIPTIKFALDQGAKAVIIISHLGRPDGNIVPNLTLMPIAAYLESILNRKVIFLNDSVSDEALDVCTNCTPGSIILLENIRFHPEEEGVRVYPDGKKEKASPDDIKKFRERLSKLGDVYVNDAFGTAHRGHSSITGISLPIRAAGFLLSKELTYFGIALESPHRPFLAILGGAKVSDKIQLIYNLLDKVDDLIIAGGMCFTFLKVLYDMEIGGSLFDEPGSKIIDRIMEKADNKGVRIHLPVDFVVGDNFDDRCNIGLRTIGEGISDGWIGLDIGPETIMDFKEVVRSSQTILWNGPMGAYEMKPFSKGSECIIHDVIETTSNGAVSIIGGGDTATMIGQLGDETGVSHISTGGGAALELLEGKELPGVTYLCDKPKVE